MTRDERDAFGVQMRNLERAAHTVEHSRRPDRDDIAESCRWAESRLKHYRERDAALSSAPPDLVRLHATWRDAYVYSRTAMAGSADEEREHAARLALLAWSPAPPVAETPDDYWIGQRQDAYASPVVAPAPVVDEATHLLWTGLVRYLDEQFGLALRPEHCLVIKSMLVNRAQPIDAPRPDRSEPIAAPAPVVETVTVTREQLASIEWALYVDAQRKCPACEALRRNDIHKPECWIAAALSPRETPDGGGR